MQYNIVKSTRDSRFEPWIYQSLVLYLWTFLNVSFIVCRLGVIIPTSQSLYMVVTGDLRIICIRPSSFFIDESVMADS